MLRCFFLRALFQFSPNSSLRQCCRYSREDGMLANFTKQLHLAGIASAFYMEMLQHHIVMYIKPWYRIGPYAIGLLLGYCLAVWQDRKREAVVCGRLKRNVMWIAAFVAAVVAIFGLYPSLQVSALSCYISLAACRSNDESEQSVLPNEVRNFRIDMLSFLRFCGNAKTRRHSSLQYFKHSNDGG